MINIRKLETELWESADLLRAGSKLTSNQYCMPVLGLIFLRYAYSRFKMVEAEILKNRPSRGGRVMPVEASDFAAKSALFLPKEAQYDYLLNLPDDISASGLVNKDGQPMTSLGEVVNNAMQLIEGQSEQLTGVLPKSYTDFSDELLSEILRIFNNSALDEVGGDIIGRIYEYFLNKFAKNIASDDGVLANSQGGFIVFGVAENEDKSIRIEGLSEIIDKAVISNGIKNFLSSHLKYEIYDFSYTTSEYEALKDKKFQMLVVEDTPEYIPFLSKKESGSLKQNMIYIRRGTSCEIANEEELQIIFNRRMNYLHPLSGEPLQLEEHLKQLKILYEKIEKNHIYYKNGLSEGMTSFLSSVANLITKGEKIVEPNPLYPDETYEEFVSRMIVEKKKKIERVLDLY